MYIDSSISCPKVRFPHYKEELVAVFLLQKSFALLLMNFLAEIVKRNCGISTGLKFL